MSLPLSDESPATVAVVGLGYVGLPLALQFARQGVTVVGIDVDAVKVERLRAGETYIRHIPRSRVAEAVASGRLRPTTDMAGVADCEAVLLCLPTPLSPAREPDLSYVLASARQLAPHLRPGSVVVLESTTYPGTTDGELRSVLEQASGLVAGRDFHLAFSPEREDPGNPSSHVETVPKLVGGLTPACRDRALAVYRQAIANLVPVSSARVAEAAKLLENIYRSVNIALVNELKLVYGAMDIDIWEVIEAASTKPFGFMPFYPGPGLGGHCIPIDPFYLTWKARQYGQHTRFIELAGEINTAMPDYVIQTVFRALNGQGLPVRGSRILILGLAYKANVDDDRESPTYVLMERLEQLGAQVHFHDPHLPVIPRTREHPAFAGRRSVEAISDDYDLILLSTAHDPYRLIDFSAYQAVLVDTRNAIPEAHRNGRYFRA
ncbi:MAG: nucleotide sugar dehydrogenase [Synechococcaceae cyanobacterium]